VQTENANNIDNIMSIFDNIRQYSRCLRYTAVG